jgi:hypothetical protein
MATTYTTAQPSGAPQNFAAIYAALSSASKWDARDGNVSNTYSSYDADALAAYMRTMGLVPVVKKSTGVNQKRITLTPLDYTVFRRAFDTHCGIAVLRKIPVNNFQTAAVLQLTNQAPVQAAMMAGANGAAPQPQPVVSNGARSVNDPQTAMANGRLTEAALSAVTADGVEWKYHQGIPYVEFSDPDAAQRFSMTLEQNGFLNKIATAGMAPSFSHYVDLDLQTFIALYDVAARMGGHRAMQLVEKLQTAVDATVRPQTASFINGPGSVAESATGMFSPPQFNPQLSAPQTSAQLPVYAAAQQVAEENSPNGIRAAYAQASAWVTDVADSARNFAATKKAEYQTWRVDQKYAAYRKYVIQLNGYVGQNGAELTPSLYRKMNKFRNYLQDDGILSRVDNSDHINEEKLSKLAEHFEREAAETAERASSIVVPVPTQQPAVPSVLFTAAASARGAARSVWSAFTGIVNPVTDAAREQRIEASQAQQLATATAPVAPPIVSVATPASTSSFSLSGMAQTVSNAAGAVSSWSRLSVMPLLQRARNGLAAAVAVATNVIDQAMAEQRPISVNGAGMNTLSGDKAPECAPILHSPPSVYGNETIDASNLAVAAAGKASQEADTIIKQRTTIGTRLKGMVAGAFGRLSLPQKPKAPTGSVDPLSQKSAHQVVVPDVEAQLQQLLGSPSEEAVPSTGTPASEPTDNVVATDVHSQVQTTFGTGYAALNQQSRMEKIGSGLASFSIGVGASYGVGAAASAFGVKAAFAAAALSITTPVVASVLVPLALAAVLGAGSSILATKIISASSGAELGQGWVKKAAVRGVLGGTLGYGIGLGIQVAMHGWDGVFGIAHAAAPGAPASGHAVPPAPAAPPVAPPVDTTVTIPPATVYETALNNIVNADAFKHAPQALRDAANQAFTGSDSYHALARVGEIIQQTLSDPSASEAMKQSAMAMNEAALKLAENQSLQGRVIEILHYNQAGFENGMFGHAKATSDVVIRHLRQADGFGTKLAQQFGFSLN